MLEKIDEFKHMLDIRKPRKQRHKNTKPWKWNKHANANGGNIKVIEAKVKRNLVKEVSKKKVKNRKKKWKQKKKTIENSQVEESLVVSNDDDNVEDEGSIDDPKFYTWNELRLNPLIIKLTQIVESLFDKYLILLNMITLSVFCCRVYFC